MIVRVVNRHGFTKRFKVLELESIKEDKHALDQENDQENKKVFLSFFLDHYRFFFLFFLVAFLVESVFSCFLTFWFSFINSRLRMRVQKAGCEKILKICQNNKFRNSKEVASVP